LDEYLDYTFVGIWRVGGDRNVAQLHPRWSSKDDNEPMPVSVTKSNLSGSMLSLSFATTELETIVRKYNANLLPTMSASAKQSIPVQIKNLLFNDNEAMIADLPGCITWAQYEYLTNLLNNVKRELSDKGLLTAKEKLHLGSCAKSYFDQVDHLIATLKNTLPPSISQKQIDDAEMQVRSMV